MGSSPHSISTGSGLRHSSKNSAAWTSDLDMYLQTLSVKMNYKHSCKHLFTSSACVPITRVQRTRQWKYPSAKPGPMHASQYKKGAQLWLVGMKKTPRRANMSIRRSSCFPTYRSQLSRGCDRNRDPQLCRPRGTRNREIPGPT